MDKPKILLRMVLAVCAPFLLALFPGFGFNNYTYSVLNFALIYIIVVIGLNLLTGYAGQISLGQSGLLAIGAYTTALAQNNGLPFFPAAIIATVVTGLVGFGLAWPVLRLTGPYLALATVGFGVSVPQFLKFLHFRTDGIEGLKITQPNLPFFDPQNDLARYYLLMPIVGVVYLLSRNLTKSKIGRALIAVREDTVAAQAMGIDLTHYKVLVFTTSAALTGLAGSLYIAQIGRVSSEDFNLLQSIYFVTMLVVGGLGTLDGPIFGAILLTVLHESVNRLSDVSQQGLNGLGFDIQLKNPQYILYGLLILLFVLYMPNGVAGFLQKFKDKEEKIRRK